MSVELIFEDESYERAFTAGELSEAGAVTLVGEGATDAEIERGCSALLKLSSVTTVRAAEAPVREYLSRFADEPFAPGAIDFLAASLAPVFARFGYEPDVDSPYVTVAFAAGAGDTLVSPSRPLPDGVSLVWCADGEGERYDFSLIEGGADDGECALAVRGDVVLCAAGINDLRRDGYDEIYVECAEESRRRGLGSACVAMLSSRLFAAGRGVRYETTGDNAASLALARSLGMREIERIVIFCALG